MNVIPAVIPESRKHLEETLALVFSFAQDVQIDITDGVFVPNTSFPYNDNTSISTLEPLLKERSFELDLMINKPEEAIDEWLLLNPSRVVMHIESTKAISKCIQKVKDTGTSIGLSLNNDTNLSVLDPYYDEIDFVQVMGIAQIGKQGESFDERVLERITAIRNNHPECEVSVDGSVNKETIVRLREVGATRFVAGSAILKADNPKEAFEELLMVIQ